MTTFYDALSGELVTMNFDFGRGTDRRAQAAAQTPALDALIAALVAEAYVMRSDRVNRACRSMVPEVPR